MTIVRMIDSIVEWLNDNVCPKIEMKLPPKDGEANNKNYEYELTHPCAFPLYVPPRDKLAPQTKAVIPSICVQLEFGTDLNNNRELNLNLSFAGWNPGVHPDDWLIPGEEEPEDKDTLSRLSAGWRELWNMVDIAVTEIESTGFLGADVEVVKNEPLEFGCYKDQDSIPSYYPHWFAYCKFKVRSMILRNDQELINLL